MVLTHAHFGVPGPKGALAAPSLVFKKAVLGTLVLSSDSCSQRLEVQGHAVARMAPGPTSLLGKTAVCRVVSRPCLILGLQGTHSQPQGSNWKPSWPLAGCAGAYSPPKAKVPILLE